MSPRIHPMVPRTGHIKRTRINVVHPFCHVKIVGTSNLLLCELFSPLYTSSKVFGKGHCCVHAFRTSPGEGGPSSVPPKTTNYLPRTAHVTPSRMQAGRKDRWISTRVARSWVTHTECDTSHPETKRNNTRRNRVGCE